MWTKKHIESYMIKKVNSKSTSLRNLVKGPHNKRFLEKYMEVRNIDLTEYYRITTQYVFLMDSLHDFYVPVQSNSFKEKLKCWREKCYPYMSPLTEHTIQGMGATIFSLWKPLKRPTLVPKINSWKLVFHFEEKRIGIG